MINAGMGRSSSDHQGVHLIRETFLRLPETFHSSLSHLTS